MKKPKPKVTKHLDYDECAKYVEQKLGYDLRDTQGKFTNGKLNEDVEYRDFWHFLVDATGLHNGCEIYMPEEADEQWQQEIIDMFLNEFGRGPYWVEW